MTVTQPLQSSESGKLFPSTKVLGLAEHITSDGNFKHSKFSVMTTFKYPREMVLNMQTSNYYTILFSVEF